MSGTKGTAVLKSAFIERFVLGFRRRFGLDAGLPAAGEGCFVAGIVDGVAADTTDGATVGATAGGRDMPFGGILGGFETMGHSGLDSAARSSGGALLSCTVT